MDERAMIDLSSVPLHIALPAFFLGGLLIGYGYFRALLETANLIVREGQPLLGLALTLGRLSLLVSGFYIAVLAGGLALLTAFAGVLCAKVMLLYRVGREAL